MYEYRAHNLARVNPFLDPENAPKPEEEYSQKIRDIARRFIYAENMLDTKKISAAINIALHEKTTKNLERESHGLEALAHLLKGIEAQEHADSIFGGAWQAALLRQGTQHPLPPKPPETLTRAEVSREFEVFRFRQDLIDAEETALLEYSRLLSIGSFESVRVDDRPGASPAAGKIEITRGDIEALVNDLRVRSAERIPDDEERKASLMKLDDELLAIINRLPQEQAGKRFEIEVIYLIRRLIHAADEGHLVSVYHASPRADLRKDMGNIDIELDVAGQPFLVQLKTFNRGAQAERRDIQLMVLDHAAKKAKDSGTTLVTLDSSLVESAFSLSLKSDTGEEVSRLGKKEALAPLLDMVEEGFDRSVLRLFSLTEAEMAKEMSDLSKNQDVRSRLDEEWRPWREAEAAREAEIRAAEERRRQEALAERQEALAKAEAIKERERRAALDAQAEREALAKAKQEKLEAKQREREAERLKREAREAEAKRKAEIKAKKEQQAESRRLKMEAKKLEVGDWPPEKLAGAFTSDMLKAYGFLPADWKDDPMQFLNAKKKLLARFAKTKKGVSPTDQSAPNNDFEKAFPYKESLSSPTTDMIERVRRIVG